jgi:hypothetical protein
LSLYEFTASSNPTELSRFSWQSYKVLRFFLEFFFGTGRTANRPKFRRVYITEPVRLLAARQRSAPRATFYLFIFGTSNEGNSTRLPGWAFWFNFASNKRDVLNHFQVHLTAKKCGPVPSASVRSPSFCSHFRWLPNQVPSGRMDMHGQVEGHTHHQIGWGSGAVHPSLNVSRNVSSNSAYWLARFAGFGRAGCLTWGVA